MTRREVLAMAASGPLWVSAAKPPVARESRRSKMGGTLSAFSVRAQNAAAGAPFDIVEQCRKAGLGGVQTSLAAIEVDMAAKLGKRVKSQGMELVLEAPPLPVEEGQLYRFDFALGACKAAGAKLLHAALAERRYQQFESVSAFQRSFERIKSYVALAVPMLEKNRVKLAIENNGDWRAAELAAWLDRLGCDYVGVCFDFAASIPLCEDPMDTLRALAPYTFMCHIKDAAVESSDDGFLVSDAPLGDGILNLKEMVRVLRAKDPAMPFYLDAATRDPVTVPVSTDRYRAVFNSTYSPLPEKDVANILELVRRNPSQAPLPRITGMAPAAAVKLEGERNLKSIEWARKNLDL
jgi:sugar phosphate isomerase/epimerase